MSRPRKLRVSIQTLKNLYQQYWHTLLFLDFVQLYKDLLDTDSTEDEIDWLKKFFEFTDENGTGKLSTAVAKAGIEMVKGQNVHYKILESIADDDGKVKIEKVLGKYSKHIKTIMMLSTLYFPEFFQIVEGFKTCESKEDSLKVFKKLCKFSDENGDGKLSEAEAKIGFERMNIWEGQMEKVFEELKDDQEKVSIEGEMTCWYKITCIQFNLLKTYYLFH